MLTYFSPLFTDFEITNQDQNFQYLFRIRDYINTHQGKILEDCNEAQLTQQILSAENRMRIEAISYAEKVEINIVT